MKATPSMLVVLGILLTAIVLRILLYGNPALSIANNDTITYVEASRAPLFSTEILSGRRLLTTNLIYKALEPESGYEILVNGSLATSRRMIQPGFDRIAIFQLVMSVIGWGFLAFTVAEILRSPFAKIAAAALIVLFAFTPQMADWDSVLMSESPTFSFFALHFAILIRLTFALYRDPQAKAAGWFTAWAVVYFFWTFIKDVNQFVALTTFGMIAALLFFARYRKRKMLYGALLYLMGMFVLGMVTTNQGVRSILPIENIYKDDMLTSPLRTSILREMGMPEPGTAEYQAWLRRHGKGALVKFMLAHPGYPAEKLLRDFPHAFEEIKQTYFKAPDLNPARQHLMTIGEAFHPESTTPFLMSAILLAGLILMAVKTPNDSRPWAWLGLWLFLSATLAIAVTILADTWAVNRHSLYSTMSYRLGMWLFAVILMDLALAQNQRESASLQEQP